MNAAMIAAPLATEQASERLATEMFLRAAGPSLVKTVAEILGTRGIPVMPLKGVLLQRLVYRDRGFRPISDVDLLVPEPRFLEAYAALRSAGFTKLRWELGDWQVTMKNPGGPPLGVDLHRRLTRTSRSRLSSAGLFARGTRDTDLFGVPIVIPSPEDLFAHLILHATLDWLNLGRLHRPRDFQAVAEVLRLDASRCAEHLARQGLTTHSRVTLPMIRTAAGGPFIDEVIARLAHGTRDRGATWIVQTLSARFAPGRLGRRLAALALAPSLSSVLFTAALDRLEQRRRKQTSLEK